MAKKKHKKEHHEEHPDERWLLTYADMITLLVALFIVMFAISSVNKGKFEKLAASMNEAFNGKTRPGGESVAETGASAEDTQPIQQPFALQVTPKPAGQGDARGGDAEAEARKRAEQEGFEELKQQIDGYTREAGLDGRVRTRVTDDGLQVRVLTDDLVFASGSAAPNPVGMPLLRKIGSVLGAEGKHPVTVEGHTDDVPIASGQFPSNWELSGARASAVARALAQGGVGPGRITAAGRAQLDPIADNDTDAGRALNRRVEILLPRLVTG